MKNIISLMILLPVFGAIVQIIVSEANKNLAKWTAFVMSFLPGLAGVLLVFSMKKDTFELQATEVMPWLASFSITYQVGLDGLNALLVLLISIVFPILVVSEWTTKRGVRGIHGLLLLLQSSLYGLTCSYDLFLIFFFWGFTCLPFYFLMSVWGEKDRERAAFRYMMTSAIGNAFLFVAIVLVYYSVFPHTFSMTGLFGDPLKGRTFLFLGTEYNVASVAFLMLCLAVALRVPVWPFHGWFSYVVTQCPAAVSVALCGVFVPVALYTFTRLSYSLFPSAVAQYSHVIIVLGAVNALLGALTAIAQRELRLLLAFLCISHVGFLLMGIVSRDAAGLSGSVYQFLSVGLALAGFGLFVGIVTGRTGKTEFLDSDGNSVLGGLIKEAPLMGLLTGVVVSSLLCIPGVGGFVGQSLIMMGGYTVSPIFIFVIGIGLVVMTFGLFSVYRQVFLGVASESAEGIGDLTLRERSYLFPVVSMLLVLGVYPKPLLELIRPTVVNLLSLVQ